MPRCSLQMSMECEKVESRLVAICLSSLQNYQFLFDGCIYVWHLWRGNTSVCTPVGRCDVRLSVCTARWSLWCRWKKSSYDNRAGWSRELSHWLLLLIIALLVCDCVWLTFLQSYLWRFCVSVLMAISVIYLDLGPSLYYIHFNISFWAESEVPARISAPLIPQKNIVDE